MTITYPRWPIAVLPDGLCGEWELWHEGAAVVAACLNVRGRTRSGRWVFVRTVVSHNYEGCLDELYDWLSGQECQEVLC